MKRCRCLSLMLLTGLLGIQTAFAQTASQDEAAGSAPQRSVEKESLDIWPQFRGIRGSGVGTGDPPIEWNVESGQNVLWKRRLDGLGHSCPIGFGDRVFLTTAVSETNNESIPTGFVGGSGESAVDSGAWRWQVAALDLRTGVEIWRRTVASGEPTIKRHLKATHANSTPATDGKYVVAFFGSEGLYCLDVDGNLLWKKDFGRLHSGPYDAPDLEWGFAGSPIIHDGKVILQCDCLNIGFVVVLDIVDGSELLRIDRDDVATWSTPAIVETATETQIVCNGYQQMAGYDLKTGDRLWTLHGGGDVPVPTPLAAEGLIFMTNGHGRSPVFAISPAARGDITPDRLSDTLPDGLAWWEPYGGSYIPTPVIVGGLLYTCSDRGVLSVRKAASGELVYQHRVGGQYSASAVATAGHVYFSSEDGLISVVETGSEYQLAATNTMHEPVFATPAILGDRLLLRTTHHLYAIGRKE